MHSLFLPPAYWQNKGPKATNKEKVFSKTEAWAAHTHPKPTGIVPFPLPRNYLHASYHTGNFRSHEQGQYFVEQLTSYLCRRPKTSRAITAFFVRCPEDGNAKFFVSVRCLCMPLYTEYQTVCLLQIPNSLPFGLGSRKQLNIFFPDLIYFPDLKQNLHIKWCNSAAGELSIFSLPCFNNDRKYWCRWRFSSLWCDFSARWQTCQFFLGCRSVVILCSRYWGLYLELAVSFDSFFGIKKTLSLNAIRRSCWLPCWFISSVVFIHVPHHFPRFTIRVLTSLIIPVELIVGITA